MTRIQRVAAASSSTNVPILPQFAIFAKLAKEFKTAETELEFETALPESFWPEKATEAMPAFRVLIGEEMVLLEAKRNGLGEVEGAGKVYIVISPKGTLNTKAKSIITTTAKITSGGERAGSHFVIGASITGGTIPANTTVVAEKGTTASEIFEVTLSAAPAATEAAVVVTLSGRHLEGTTEANHPAGASAFIFVTRNSAEDYASRFRDDWLFGNFTTFRATSTKVTATENLVSPLDAEFGKLLEVGYSSHPCNLQFEQEKIKLEENPNNYVLTSVGGTPGVGHHWNIEPAGENRTITGLETKVGGEEIPRVEVVIWCVANERVNRNTLTLKNETVGFNAETESGSEELKAVSSFAKLAIGQKLIGKGIPITAEITELKEAESKIKMSKKANATLAAHPIESIVETASSESNRFRFYPPEDIVLHQNQSVRLYKDNLSTEKRWRNSA